MFVLLFSLIFTLFILFIKIGFKIIRFTGIWIIIIGLYVFETYVLPFIIGKEMTRKNFPEIYPIYEKYMLIFLACLAILFTLRSVIRIFKPKFTYISLFRKDKFDINSIEKVTFPFEKNNTQI